MSLLAIFTQGLLLLALLLFSVIPSDGQVGAMLVWSRTDPATLASDANAHWGGLNGPMGTQVITGTAIELREQGAFVLLDLEQLATLCGVRT